VALLYPSFAPYLDCLTRACPLPHFFGPPGATRWLQESDFSSVPVPLAAKFPSDVPYPCALLSLPFLLSSACIPGFRIVHRNSFGVLLLPGSGLGYVFRLFVKKYTRELPFSSPPFVLRVWAVRTPDCVRPVSLLLFCLPPCPAEVLSPEEVVFGV